MSDLVSWVIGIWRKRGIIAEPEGVAEWFKTQDVERLERLMASGKSVRRDPRLKPRGWGEV